MRPDEHKKKQRADYKKKHGISDNSSGSKARSKSSTHHNDAGTQESETVSNTDEGSIKQYSAREVASNWNKYEDLEDSSDDEDSATSVSQRGEDFTLLLQRSANPNAQFRFQSEKDWDGDSESGPTQVTPSTLEVDFGAIAISLHCVPLHKRLNFSADHVYPDLLEAFQRNADFLLKEQCIAPLQHSDRPLKSKTREALPTCLEEPSHPLLSQTAQRQGHDMINRIITLSNKDTKPSSATLKSGNDLVHITTAQFSCSIGSANPQNTEKLETSLRDVSQNKMKNVLPSSEVQINPLNKTDDDNELEFLLSLETPKNVGNHESSRMNTHSEGVSLSTKLPSSSVPLPSLEDAQKTQDENLEDWLDSVLG